MNLTITIKNGLLDGSCPQQAVNLSWLPMLPGKDVPTFICGDIRLKQIPESLEGDSVTIYSDPMLCFYTRGFG